MTNACVAYSVHDSIATIAMDDGKVNVMSEKMQTELRVSLDRAAVEAKAVILRGRPGVFSAGYDMAMFGRARDEIGRTIHDGGELARRLLGYPKPVVALCTGHAIAQGAFLLLAADVRFGIDGAFKIGLNEVAIGLTMPVYGVEIARLRLTAPAFNRAVTTGTLFDPEEACRGGFLDQLIAPSDADRVALEEAQRLARIDLVAHAATKRRARERALEAMRAGIESELATWADEGRSQPSVSSAMRSS